MTITLSFIFVLTGYNLAIFILNVTNKFKEYKIPYGVVGGFAVALHGAIRGMVDVDCVIKWRLEHLNNIEKAMNDLGLVSMLPISAENLFKNKEKFIVEKNLIAMKLKSGRKQDLIDVETLRALDGN